MITAATLLCAAAWLWSPALRVAAGSSAHARGAEVFAQSGCEHCHGADLAGTERGPSLLQVRKHWKKAAIYQQIHDGGKEMPAFGDDLKPQQIQDLVAYLRSRHKAVRRPAPSSTNAGQGVAEQSAASPAAGQ